MPLKTVVKVGQVTTLNEARYCAGMGVDMLGFVAVEGQAHYLAPELYQEIRGWISGPRIVAEVFGLKSANEIPMIIEKYQPDFLEMNDTEYSMLAINAPLPCIVHVTRPPGPAAVAFLVIAPEMAQPVLETRKDLPPVLVKVESPEQVDSLLQQQHISGLSISASADNQSALSDVLELLDIS